MKELLLIGTTFFTLATGGITAGAIHESTLAPNVRGQHISVAMIHKAELKAQAQAKMLHELKLQANASRVTKAIKKLRSHVNKTWYVFSGATPSGWDCSGLTLWFYKQLGIELEHRASKQDTAGKKVTDPKPGDIVVFKYKGSMSAYHVAIYLGNGKMIHAPKHGHLTRVEDISSFAGNYSNISYRRLIDTN